MVGVCSALLCSDLVCQATLPYRLPHTCVVELDYYLVVAIGSIVSAWPYPTVLCFYETVRMDTAHTLTYSQTALVTVPVPIPGSFQHGDPPGARCGFWALGSGYWHRPLCHFGIACPPQSLTPGPCRNQGTIDHTFTPSRASASHLSQLPRQASLLVSAITALLDGVHCLPCYIPPRFENDGSSCAAHPNTATPPVRLAPGKSLSLSERRLAQPSSALPVAHVHFLMRPYLAWTAGQVWVALSLSPPGGLQKGPRHEVKALPQALPGPRIRGCILVMVHFMPTTVRPQRWEKAFNDSPPGMSFFSGYSLPLVGRRAAAPSTLVCDIEAVAGALQARPYLTPQPFANSEVVTAVWKSIIAVCGGCSKIPKQPSLAASDPAHPPGAGLSTHVPPIWSCAPTALRV